MKLRVHQLISNDDIESWPPAWWWKGPGDNKYPQGEVGTLKAVLSGSIKPVDRCYLIMEHEGAEYLGILVFKDYDICQRVYELLLEHRGKPIAQIGDIDVSPT